MLTRTNLRHYQNDMENWILNRDRCALFAECGLGKTIATLSAIDTLLQKFEVFRVLVCAPKRVAASVWAQEAKNWSHTARLSVLHLSGTPKQRLKLLEQEPDITTIGVDLLPWLIDHYGKKWPYDCVVLDESSLFKNWSSKRVKKLKTVSHIINRLVCLTGTPAANGLLNLFPQLYFIDHGERLGSGITKYKKRWFNQSWNGFDWTPRPGAEQEIHAVISDVCMSLRTMDYLELPPMVDNLIELDMPRNIKAQYSSLEKEFYLQLEQDITASTAAVLTNKLLQFCSGAIYDEDKTICHVHDIKLDELENIIESATGQPVLIAINFQHDRDRILKRFPQAKVLDSDPQTVDDWNNKKIPILVAHPASCGHGLNLQSGGNILVWFSLTYDLELFQQMNARLMRQGQNKPVINHYITLKGSIEHTVLKVLESKDCTQKSLMNALKKRGNNE